ncbi:Rec8 like protein-domain-containing protein [Pseudoneurospora amorphoporcata]|uniref:Rec8 like protein-domain-containing protein n=1 Tax=Pseudoneurospora amorphoporcata TaxID=241081 RepID=A0AAN6P5Z2_9PEZI|nr:Rec8 like protein-domain-containing protein [Pseudoneurospora amorphoporcata]
MFYSHEILTNQQYGVATVWLVSTFGLRSSNRKISRKAIQEVNVRKACETILQPGAPIALRLQGSLLYGVSRVFSQQCSYVLTDAERVHMHMRCFYNVLGGCEHALDPQAGKAKRNQLILPDDPDFEVNMGLPAFHFDEEGNLASQFHSQASRKTSSQFSPLDRFNLTPDGSGSFIIGLDLPQSSPVDPPYSQHSSYSLGPLSQHKPDDDMMQFGEPEANAEIFGDWGIEIDADGNVMATVDEPELPILPRPEEERAHATASGQIRGESEFYFDDQGDLLMNEGTAPPPEADEVPGLIPDQVEQAQEDQIMEEAEEAQVIADEPVVEAVAAPVLRRQRRRAVLAPDEDTKISRHELKSWSNDYLANVERANNASRRAAATNPAAAKKHAYDLVFGRGVGGVGTFDNGLDSGNHRSHPLASLFAGADFAAEVLDMEINVEDQVGGRRSRRRTALEALELEEEDAERRVRRRLSNENEEEQQQEQPQQNPEPQTEAGRGLFTGGAEEDAEIGRRDGSALPDIPSDAPWNRPPSLVPGSSVKGDSHHPGSSRQVSASPLHSRGSHLAHLPPIDRLSDAGSYAPFLHSGGVTGFSSDPIMPPGEDEPQLPHLPGGSHGSQLLRRSPSGEAGAGTQAVAETSQVMRDALDRDGRNFLTYVNMVAKTRGETRSLGGGTPSQAVGDGDGNRRLRQWVAFDELLDEPRDRTRQVATQAFYNVLVLATKNAIKVEQDMEDFQPFGEIRVGVEVSEAEMLGMMEEDGDE